MAAAANRRQVYQGKGGSSSWAFSSLQRAPHSVAAAFQQLAWNGRRRQRGSALVVKRGPASRGRAGRRGAGGGMGSSKTASQCKIVAPAATPAATATVAAGCRVEGWGRARAPPGGPLQRPLIWPLMPTAETQVVRASTVATKLCLASRGDPARAALSSELTADSSASAAPRVALAARSSAAAELRRGRRGGLLSYWPAPLCPGRSRPAGPQACGAASSVPAGRLSHSLRHLPAARASPRTRRRRRRPRGRPPPAGTPTWPGCSPPSAPE